MKKRSVLPRRPIWKRSENGKRHKYWSACRVAAKLLYPRYAPATLLGGCVERLIVSDNAVSLIHLMYGVPRDDVAADVVIFICRAKHDASNGVSNAVLVWGGT